MRPWHLVVAATAALTLGTLLGSVPASWAIFIASLLTTLTIEDRLQ